MKKESLFFCLAFSGTTRSDDQRQILLDEGTGLGLYIVVCTCTFSLRVTLEKRAQRTDRNHTNSSEGLHTREKFGPGTQGHDDKWSWVASGWLF